MKISWLKGLLLVFWWIELASVSLKGGAMSSSMFWGVYVFGMGLDRLSANVQICVPVFLKDWCGVSGTGACWLLGGFGYSAEMKAFGRAHAS